MKIVPWMAGACLCLGLTVGASGQSGAPASKAAQIERGKYLASGVGMCGDCHTPMNERGEHVVEKWLKGAPVMIKPPFPIPNWAETAPDITAMKGWTDADYVKFLMTGIQPNGEPARPPMPSYRLNKEDAEAVTAYLRSMASPEPSTEAKK